MDRSPLLKLLGGIPPILSFHNVMEMFKNVGMRSPSTLVRNIGAFVVGSLFAVLYVAWRDKKLYLLSLDDPTPTELTTMPPKTIAVHSMFMTRTASRVLGRIMRVSIPRIMRKPLYSSLSMMLGINTHEFEGSFEDYCSPNEFFTRSLKTGARQIVQHEDILVSPCDGTVSFMDINPITTPKIQAHQVKGVRYLLTEFLGCSIPQTRPINNMYSITLYLSPSDYHRVHSPTYFTLTDRVHFPGKLLPVKNYYVQNVKGLFTINERVILTGYWPQGFFSLGLVGAYNVGSIALANEQDCDLRTNRMRSYRRRERNVCYRKHYGPEMECMPGDTVGTFHLGSTVVLAFESKEFTWLVKPGEKVKMGQPIGYTHYSSAVKQVCETGQLMMNSTFVNVDDETGDSDETVSVGGAVEEQTVWEDETIELEESGNYHMEEVEEGEGEGEGEEEKEKETEGTEEEEEEEEEEEGQGQSSRRTIYRMKSVSQFKRQGSWTHIDLNVTK